MSRRVGLCAFVAALACLAVRPAAAEPLVVLSYNLRNWLADGAGPAARKASGAPKTESEKNAALAIIAAHRPDVVGVCEIGGRAELEDLRARLKASGLDYPHAEWHEAADAERHVALLSRFPIVARDSQARIAFGLAGQPESVQRGILDVTIEPRPGYRLRLIGLHLKSRRQVPQVDQEILRAKEAWFVRQYLDHIFEKDPAARLLLFGDLNATKDEYPIPQIQGPVGSPGRLSEIPVADDRGERWTHYYPLADAYSRIDYHLASPALRPEIDQGKSGIDSSRAWSEASDHRALFTTIVPP